MTAPIVGFTVRREAYEPAPPSNAVMSVVGLVGPASAGPDVESADFNAAFPVDEPVTFNSGDRIARMLDPDGLIGDALSGVNAQAARLQTSARVVYVRTEEGADIDATIANIVGSAASATGVHALKSAGTHVGVIPRLIVVPGFTSQQETSLEANPVAAELAGVLPSFLGIGIVDAPSTDRDDAVAYRETLSSERLMVVDPAVKTRNAAGQSVLRPLSSRVAGLFVRRDFEAGGRPFRSILNQPVYGVEGPARGIPFSLTDGATEGQDLLARQIGPLIRGESGDDFSISDGGFVSLAFENTSSETIWRQIHKVRGRDFIELTAMRTLRDYFGRFNLTTHTIQAVVNTLNNIIDIAVAKGELLGGLARFDPDENNPSELRQGKIYADLRFEEAPVFRAAELISRPYTPALEKTIESLASGNLPG